VRLGFCSVFSSFFPVTWLSGLPTHRVLRVERIRLDIRPAGWAFCAICRIIRRVRDSLWSTRLVCVYHKISMNFWRLQVYRGNHAPPKTSWQNEANFEPVASATLRAHAYCARTVGGSRAVAFLSVFKRDQKNVYGLFLQMIGKGSSGKSMSKNHTTWYDLKNSKKWDLVHTKTWLETQCGMNKQKSLQNQFIFGLYQ